MKKGVTLIAAVFIVLVMTLLAITISTYVSSDAVIAVKNYNSLDAFYVAASGVEYYLKQLDGDSDWSSPPSQESKAFSGGVFTIATTDETKNRITFTSTGLVTLAAKTYRRTIRSTVKRTAGGLAEILAEYVVYLGEGSGEGSAIGNNVSISGDIFVNSDLDIGYNCNISGDAHSTGTIETGDNTEITGTTESDAEPPYDPPTLESSFYDNQIAIAAASPEGDQSWSGYQDLSGSYYINGNVVFELNANINITGAATIAATGTVLVRNNTTIGDNIMVIADGLITIENNVNLGKDGLWYSSVGFDVGNNAEVGDVNVGEGTIFITPGDILFGNNVEYYGFIYCGGDFTQTGNNFYFEGNIIVGGDINVDNNTTLVLNPDLVEIDELIGIEAGEGVAKVEITEWDEAY